MGGRRLTVKNVQICGMQAQVTRKPIRNMYLRIRPDDGTLLISAPMQLPDSEIRRFVESRMEWILRHRGQTQRERETAGRETVFLWGKEYPIRYQALGCGEKERIETDGSTVTFYVHGQERRKELEDAWYTEELRRVLPRYTQKWERITGLAAAEWKIRNMKTRWGSCTVRTRRIRLASQLAALPAECLEYVIVHELMHLREAGHNERFWALVESYCPNYREIRRRMRG